LEYATHALEEGEQPMLPELKRITQQLQSIGDIVPTLQPLQQRLSSVYEELKDISAELDQEKGKVALDPEVMNALQQRLDLGYKLLKKHAVGNTEALLELQANLSNDLKAANDLSEAIANLEADEEAAFMQIHDLARVLSEKRHIAIPAFIVKMNELLALVGMPNARFEVGMESVEPTNHGIDHILFLIDANKSGQFQPLQKAASGGEMSRIMLCIKSLTARALHMPTLIFDEVDTGISGEAARQVGALLKELAQYHQVICITHQPQVAARGTRHFYVYKQPDTAGKFTTQVKTLQQNERILAIARMIGGEQPSAAAMSNAQELVEG
jgi:DNA repair protein RecN (Recombination protein N)